MTNILLTGKPCHNFATEETLSWNLRQIAFKIRHASGIQTIAFRSQAANNQVV
jgi:hypothetical protein